MTIKFLVYTASMLRCDMFSRVQRKYSSNLKVIVISRRLMPVIKLDFLCKILVLEYHDCTLAKQISISYNSLKFNTNYTRAKFFFYFKFEFVTNCFYLSSYYGCSSCCVPILSSHTMICGCKIYDDFCKMSFCRWHNLEQLSGQHFLTFFTQEKFVNGNNSELWPNNS